MDNNQKPQYDCEAIARQIYDWLKNSYLPMRISTSEAMEIMGLCNIEEDDPLFNDTRAMFDINYALMKIIKEEKEYVADHSEFAGMVVGLPFNIPFVFREKKRKGNSVAHP